MSSAELAFFACAVSCLAAFAWAMRGGSASWLWWSGIGPCLLLDAPIVALALAALGAAQWGRAKPSGAAEPAPGHAPRWVLALVLAYVAISTWARQIVTPGVTREEAPEFGAFDWFAREGRGAGYLSWLALVALALLVGAAVGTQRSARSEDASAPGGER